MAIFAPMLRKLYYLLSPKQRLIARRIAFFPSDAFDWATGRRHELVPPRGMIYTGTGDYLKAGKQFLSLFIEHGKLKPHHRVLDVGSGVGRMAVPLTGYLSNEGSYEGFDIVETGVDWCQKKISTRFPNFRFRLIHLKNDLYSSKGATATQFDFPYGDNEFDFVFLTSVFTHMLPDEVAHYLKEIGRVLKPGGNCLATFFLFGDDMPQETSDKYFSFSIDKGYYRLLDARVKSANVAFDATHVKNTLAKNAGLTITLISPGFWRNCNLASQCEDFQDIAIFRKP